MCVSNKYATDLDCTLYVKNEGFLPWMNTKQMGLTDNLIVNSIITK